MLLRSAFLDYFLSKTSSSGKEDKNMVSHSVIVIRDHDLHYYGALFILEWLGVDLNFASKFV